MTNNNSTLLFVHEQNIKTKIKDNYKGKKDELTVFFESKYMPMRIGLLNLDLKEGNLPAFEQAAEMINRYFDSLWKASLEYGITSQSKFESTYYEEINSYLFHKLPEIQTGKYAFFNKGIYAGLKIDNHNHVSIIKKDVDFCIGKKTMVRFDDQDQITLILPIVAVEVKTYMDATMFGEIKSSSKAIRSASPNSKAYVLMGYKDLADEHIIAARQDATLTEMFALRKNQHARIDAKVLHDYYVEISNAVSSVMEDNPILTPGKLLFP